jgi:hypothetical protein
VTRVTLRQSKLEGGATDEDRAKPRRLGEELVAVARRTKEDGGALRGAEAHRTADS